MAFRYWVATSGGTWNSTSSWSSTSGGASGSSVPTKFDDVIFDANSITSANRVITINTDSCNTLNLTNLTNSPTFRIINAGDLFVYGNIYFPASGIKWQSTTGVSGILLAGSNRVVEIDTNGLVIDLDYIATNTTNSTIELLSDLNIKGAIQVSHTGWTFNTNGYDITTSAFSSSAAITIDSGDTIFNLDSKGGTPWTIAASSSVDFTNNTINLNGTANSIITLGAYDYGTVNIYNTGTTSLSGSSNGVVSSLNIARGTTNITGDKKFTTLTVQRGATCGLGGANTSVVSCTNNGTLNTTVNGVYINALTVGRSSTTKPTAGTTLNINSLTSNSVSGALAVIESATAGTSAYINLATGVFENNYLDIQDITLTGGGSWYAGANSTNGGNNGNIIFANLPTYLNSKEVEYIVYEGYGGSRLGTLNSVVNDFQFANEINTGGGSVNIELKADPNTDFDNGLYQVDNHIEVWIKDRQAPNGTRIFQGFVSNVVLDYDNEKITLEVSGYGEKLDKFIILTEDSVDQSVTAVNGDFRTDQVSAGDLTGYAYYQFTTGASVTNITAIELKLEPPIYYLGFHSVRVKLFRTSGEAENITTDTSIGTTAYVDLSTPGASNVKMTFTSPVTVSGSTTYYYRLEVLNSGPYNIGVKVYGDDSAGASAGAKVYTFGSWQYPSIYSEDTIYPFINTYYGSEDTTITYSTTEISDIFKSVVDSYNTQGGELIYTPLSIDTTGVTITHSFNTDNVKDGLDLCRKAAPRGWFYYVDNATNIIYFKPERSVENIDHKLPKGGGLENVKLKVDGSNLYNTVYFTGGDTGGGSNLFTKYIDETSIINYGKLAKPLNDGRVTVSATASSIGEAFLDQFAEPNIIIEASQIDDNKGVDGIGYDLESLKLGQNIMLTGYGANALWDSAIIGVDEWDYLLNAISSQILQIARIDYTLGKVVFKLNLPSNTIFKTISSSKRDIDVLNTTNNPSGPS